MHFGVRRFFTDTCRIANSTQLVVIDVMCVFVFLISLDVLVFLFGVCCFALDTRVDQLDHSAHAGIAHSRHIHL